MKTMMNLICGGRMVKWKGCVASLAPALASVSVVALMATGAVGQTVITGTNVTQLITVDEDITVSGHVNILDSVNYNLDLVAVDTGSDYASTFINNGVIEGNIAYTSGIDTGAVVGLTIYNGLAGSMVNNGEISLDLISNDSTDPSATGVWIDGDVSGSILNAGTISATMSTSYSTALAYGLYVTGSVTDTGSITNSGTISATARSDSDAASAYGIYLGFDSGDLAGAFTNTASGVISVLAHSGNYTATAEGIYLSGDVTDTGSITNAGSISVTADAE